MGRFQILTYSPKPGKEDALLSAVRRHLKVLRTERLVTYRPACIMRARDGTIVEVFEWRSTGSLAKAHRLPAVQVLWAEFEMVCDYRPLSALSECQDRFAEFEAVMP
jgi:hypothetical protein